MGSRGVCPRLAIFELIEGVLGDGQYADGEAAVCLTTSGDIIRGVDVVGSSILP